LAIFLGSLTGGSARISPIELPQHSLVVSCFDWAVLCVFAWRETSCFSVGYSREGAKSAKKNAKEDTNHPLVVGQFEMWHGRPAREITRKMRVPQQTDPLPTRL
jgi:hypothetical protein